MLSLVLIVHILIYPLIPAHAFNRVLSVPGQPFFISIEQRKYEDEQVRKAYLRTSTELYRLFELEGLKYRDSSYSIVNADNDGIEDLIWKIEVEDPEDKSTLIMWIATLSSIKQGWVFYTPSGETRWNNLHLDLNIPQNVILYYSPTTPEYREIEQYRGRGIFTFVYTIAITADGPILVSVPEVYEEFAKISRMLIADEADPRLRLVYENIWDDYNRMKEGKMPSKEAVLNFVWERVLDFNWE